jgi:hypothetical protein
LSISPSSSDGFLILPIAFSPFFNRLSSLILSTWPSRHERCSTHVIFSESVLVSLPKSSFAFLPYASINLSFPLCFYCSYPAVIQIWYHTSILRLQPNPHCASMLIAQLTVLLNHSTSQMVNDCIPVQWLLWDLEWIC